MDVTRMCLRATFDIRRRVCVHYFVFIATSTDKCSIKNALAHTCSCFLWRRIYIHFCHMRLTSVSRTFQLLLVERITFDIQGSVLNILSWPTCLHASSSTESSVYAYVLSNENALVWLERTDYDTFQCKRHVSPYEAMGTRVRVRLRVRLNC